MKTKRYNYNAFGKLAIYDASGTARASSSYAWTRTFTGQVHDPETGIMLYRNRYYHPTLGRFVTRDLIGYRGKDINLGRYVNNYPILYIDSFGHLGFWQGKWWYDRDRTWGDWFHGWIDWTYNTVSPSLSPPVIGECVGGLDCAAEIFQPNNIENYFTYRRDRYEEGTEEYEEWNRRYDTCRERRQHTP